MTNMNVGPSDCGAERDGRNQWIKDLIEHHCNGINDARTNGAMVNAITFFMEALGCYQNANYVACASMCGAAVENVLLELLLYDHKYAVRDSSSGNYAWSYLQEFKDGKFRDYFREMVSPEKNRFRKREETIKYLKNSNRLDRGTAEITKVILDLRDQAMHYTENTWRKFFKNAAEIPINEEHFWPFGEDKVRDVIEDTICVLSFAAKQFLAKVNKASSI